MITDHPRRTQPIKWQKCYLISAFCVFLSADLAELSHRLQQPGAGWGLGEGGGVSDVSVKGKG